MQDITGETRRRILDAIEDIQGALFKARNSTKVPPGYQNFDLALSILSGCRESISQMLEQEQIIEILRQASRKLDIWKSGPAEPAMRSARLAINDLVADLEKTPLEGGE